MRLIDADALMRKFKTASPVAMDGRARQIVEDMPTIEERDTGAWCVTPDGRIVCSNCFENPTNRIIINGALVYDMTPIKKRMRYCPNCGARMVREGEDNERA